MKIFLSYPSARRDAAEGVCYELQAEGHEVFFDKEDLPAGRSFNERIRGAIEDSDLLIFMITPESVAEGKYTLTELKIARKRWPNPAGRVLPVMLEPMPFDDIPAYLKAVTVLSPEGDLAAEIVMEVADLAASREAPTELVEAPEVDLPSFSYQPLEIRFGEGAAGSYPISVTGSPVGSQSGDACPIDPAALEQLLWSSAGRIDGTVRRARVELGETGEDLLPSAADAKIVGERLYESLFSSTMRPCLEGSLRSVDPQRGEGLRFLINTTEAPDLARLPWEFLYSPEQDDFLFSDRMKPVIRWLDVDQPPPTLLVEPPLRLLVAVASPTDQPELSVGEELAHLDGALRDLVDEGLVETVRLEHTSLEKLDDALLANKPHVLHFIGHGGFSGDEGVIILDAEAPRGAGNPITGRQLGVLLRNHLGSLRFVFLNSCSGAAVSVKDPFGGVAQSLIQRGIPAVIAMQFPIPDRVAITLARHFYRYLAAGLPVDTALTSARAFLFAAGHAVEWGAPALYMRTPDGRLFDVASTSGQAPPPAEPPVVPPPVTAEPPPSTVEPPISAQESDTAAAGSARSAEERRAEKGRRNLLPWVALAALLGLAAIAVLIGSVVRFGGGAASMRSPVEEAYAGALDELARGNSEGGLQQLADARREDPDLSTLEGLPELRAALLDGLAAGASGELARGDLQLARQLVEELLAIDPNHTQGRQLRDEIARLMVPPSPPPPPPPPPEQVHYVEPGDSLWTIAGSAYGDPARWPLIYEANRDMIANPDLIFPGQEVVTPLLPLSRETPPPADGRRVQAGDSLWKIAVEVYGDPLRWPEIYDANRDRIADPDLIFPNQVFVIPPR